MMSQLYHDQKIVMEKNPNIWYTSDTLHTHGRSNRQEKELQVKGWNNPSCNEVQKIKFLSMTPTNLRMSSFTNTTGIGFQSWGQANKPYSGLENSLYLHI